MEILRITERTNTNPLRADLPDGTLDNVANSLLCMAASLQASPDDDLVISERACLGLQALLETMTKAVEYYFGRFNTTRKESLERPATA